MVHDRITDNSIDSKLTEAFETHIKRLFFMYGGAKTGAAYVRIKKLLFSCYFRPFGGDFNYLCSALQPIS